MQSISQAENTELRHARQQLGFTYSDVSIFYLGFYHLSE